MSKENVIKNFLNNLDGATPLRNISNGLNTYKGRTLYTNGNKLINYNTIIARLDGNILHLNIKKYSSTTSHIQSQIRRIASSMGLEIVERMGEC